MQPGQVGFFGGLVGWLILAAIIALAWLGYVRAPWWQPVVAGAIVIAGRELISGGQVTSLTMSLGIGFLIRSLVMGAILCAIPWAIGYGASFLF